MQKKRKAQLQTGGVTEAASSDDEDAEETAGADTADAASVSTADSADAAADSGSSDGTADEEAEDGTASDDTQVSGDEAADDSAADAEGTGAKSGEDEEALEEAEEETEDEDSAADEADLTVLDPVTATNADGEELTVSVIGDSALLAGAEVRVTFLEDLSEEAYETYQSLLDTEAGDGTYAVETLADISLVKWDEEDEEYKIFEPGETVTVQLSGSLVDAAQSEGSALVHFAEETAVSASDSAEDAAEAVGSLTVAYDNASALAERTAEEIESAVAAVEIRLGDALADTSALTSGIAQELDSVEETDTGVCTVEDGTILVTTNSFSAWALVAVLEDEEESDLAWGVSKTIETDEETGEETTWYELSFDEDWTKISDLCGRYTYSGDTTSDFSEDNTDLIFYWYKQMNTGITWYLSTYHNLLSDKDDVSIDGLGRNYYYAATLYGSDDEDDPICYKLAAGEGCTGYIDWDICIWIEGDVVIDLNGCQLWLDTTVEPTTSTGSWRQYGAFRICSGGSLTIIDSSAEYSETTTKTAVTDGSKELYGNESTLESSEDKDGNTVWTLTYYVTESETDTENTGHTTETLYEYTRTITCGSKAGIYSDNSNQNSSFEYAGQVYGNCMTLFMVEYGTLNLEGGTYSNYSGGQCVYAGGSYHSGNIAVNIDNAVICDTSKTNIDYREDYGKAIHIAAYSGTAALTMTGGAILNNLYRQVGVAYSSSYPDGGAIWALGADVTISGGTIAGNTANKGGAIYLGRGSLTLSGDSVVAGNYACYCGGAIYAEYSTSSYKINSNEIGPSSSYSDSTVTVSGDAVISGNGALDQPTWEGMSDAGGGGIYIGAGENGTATVNLTGGYITNNFVDNAAYNNNSVDGSNGSDGGGGVYIAVAKVEDQYTTGSWNAWGTWYQSVSTEVTIDSTTYWCRYAVLNVLGDAKITGNYAKESGGGVYAAGTLNMTGGIIASNVAGQDTEALNSSDSDYAAEYARGAEGGGIRIQAGSILSTISGGYITNNTTNTAVDWGGGGIFVSDYSELTIDAVLIEGNTAEGYGGGVAGCPTGYAEITGAGGSLIYNNTANGENTSVDTVGYSSYGSVSSQYDIDALIKYASINYFSTITTDDGETIDLANAPDFFAPLYSQISGTALGGGSQEWTGQLILLSSSDGSYSISGSEIVTIEGDEIYSLEGSALGLKADPTEETISAAESVATTYITGNYSNTNGGGIMTNGTVHLGSSWTAVESPGAEIEADKSYVDGDGNALSMDEGLFSFVLLSSINSDGSWSEDDVVATAVNDANGLIELLVQNFYIQDYENNALSTDDTMIYTYYLTEKTTDAEVSAWDDAVYVITITVDKTVASEHPLVLTDSSGTTTTDSSTLVNYYLYSVTNVSVSKGAKGSTEVTSLTEGTDYKVTYTEDSSIVLTTSTSSSDTEEDTSDSEESSDSSSDTSDTSSDESSDTSSEDSFTDTDSGESTSEEESETDTDTSAGTTYTIYGADLDLTLLNAAFVNTLGEPTPEEEEEESQEEETTPTPDEEETEEETAAEEEEEETTAGEEDEETTAEEEDEETEVEESESEESEDSETDSLNKTGDAAMPLFWGLLLLLAACGIAGVIYTARRKHVH